jgi:hypothetical protein
MTKLSRVNNYEELVEYLRTWTSAHDDPPYDFAGMVYLLEACLENLRRFLEHRPIKAKRPTLLQRLGNSRDKVVGRRPEECAVAE